MDETHPVCLFREGFFFIFGDRKLRPHVLREWLLQVGRAPGIFFWSDDNVAKWFGNTHKKERARWARGK